MSEHDDQPAASPAGETADGQPVVLRTRDLTVVFRTRHGQTRALDGVSLDVHASEVVGIVGESGSGKSTLGRAIAGLVRPTSGSVESQPAPGGGRPQPAAGVQIVLQDSASALDPRLTVGQAVAEPLARGGRISRKQVARAAAYLERVGLPAAYSARRPRELSGGERQRAAIARALAAAPKILVCDEITSALDVTIQASIVELIQNLRQQESVEILFISHDIAVVKELADRIIVMKDGKIVEEGPASEVIFHPKNSYTQRLIAAVPTMRSRSNQAAGK